MQLVEYDERRYAFMVVCNGLSPVYISPFAGDTECCDGQGLYIPPNGHELFTWILHGELVWQTWYVANCRSTVFVYEWYNRTEIDPRCLSPVRTICDCAPRKVCGPVDPPPIRLPNPPHRSLCKLLRQIIERAKSES